MKVNKDLIFKMLSEILDDTGVIEEAISGSGLHDLVGNGTLYDIEQKIGIKSLLNAAYISGQRNEPIEDLNDGDPWFEEKFPLLLTSWKEGRQWAKEQYPDRKKTTLNRASLYETIAEVMSETEENFGATPSGGLLHEAWDSGWPKHFEELRSHIADQTTKGKIAHNILFKYSMDSLVFRFLDAGTIWDKYVALFNNLTSLYFQNMDDRPKDFMKAGAFVKIGALNKHEKQDWFDRVHDANIDKGSMGKLRALNKMISSIDKQLGRFWKSIEGLEEEVEHFDMVITKEIQSLQFQEANLMTSRILNIIQFVNMDKGEDNAKKLTAFRKKTEKEADDDNINVLAISRAVNIIAVTDEWIEDELLRIDMTPCDDKKADYDAPCVFHQFDDGFFWYDIRSNSCDLSARHLNNCGQASMDGSELFNLMSYSETGKPRWHVMIEWNQEEKSIIQVLGNSNQVPKEEYWPQIKWFYEKMGKPEISNYAWEHVQGSEVKRNVYNFLMYLGLKSDQPLTEEWNQMKQQIDDGFYNVQSWDGELDTLGHREGDFSRLRFIAHANRIDMSIRIKRRLLKVGSEATAATYEDVRDYKNAAKRLHRTEVLADEYILDMIPREWNEFFNAEGMTQRVRFSHGGNMMLYFNWTSIPLQQMEASSNATSEYRNQLQREGLAFFMKDMMQNFSVEAMTKLGKDVGQQLALVADEILMSRPMGDLDEGKKKMKLDRKYLKNIILEVLEESKYYDKHKGMDTDYATQAMELGQSMSDEGSRDRSEQVEKYVQLKVNKEIKKELIAQVQWAIDNLVREAAGATGITGDEINSSFYEDDMQHFRNMYSKKLTRSMELAQTFDGTQESVDAWTQEMMRVEKVLYNSKDMGIHYLGSIIPYVLHIGDAFWQSYDGGTIEWGGNYQKSVELEKAVEQAEDFYRPGITKMVLKAQNAETGMDLGDAFGLNEK